MPKPPAEPKPPFNWVAIAIVAALIIATYLLVPALAPQQRVYDVSYTRFKQLIDDDRVAQVELRGERVAGKLTSPGALGPKGESGTEFITYIPAVGDDALLPALERQGVEVRVVPAQAGGWTGVLIGFLPWLLFLGFWLWLMQRVYKNIAGGVGGRTDLKKFLEPAGAKTAEVPDVKFDDVAGQENAKREVAELVDYLRDPAQFRKLGAEVPHGVLLMGPPGTGKTLLARALAGEAGVPFFSITGSEFIEVFVGVGASRVRKLFESAKQAAPAIVFIDELDSVGRTRGTGLGGGHDEREQTLNQILAEMDGFKGHEAIIVLAATNRPDVLDPALLRPGRFDRHVTLDLPDRNDREKILAVHTRKVPLADDVKLPAVAAGTPGFSGADLKNLVNEAAIYATRERCDTVAMQHFDQARDKLMLGTERTLVIQPDERHRLAVHEAGHTALAHFLPHADPLYKVTIIPRGRSLGGTHQLPEQERHTLPEEYLRDRLAVILGGRAAEQEILGSISSGADDDIRQATQLARAMVARWGMSPDIGPVDLRESEEHPFLGREIAQPRRFSETSAQAVDRAVRDLLVDAERRAQEVIRAQRARIDRLIATLEEHETLYREQIEQCLAAASDSARQRASA
jgi:cell division protease FtsH